MVFLFFFFNDTATTEIYTLSLHDALPIFPFRIKVPFLEFGWIIVITGEDNLRVGGRQNLIEGHLIRCADRKSTRLNSSHSQISYAVFCLKKKKPALFRLHCSFVYAVRRL